MQTSLARRVNRYIFASDETLHAPHLVDLEVTQALRRYVRTGIILADRGAEALADLSDLPLTRYPHQVLLPRIWELRHGLTAYDAAYLALAEVLGAPLITRDRALANASSHVRVELI